MNSQHILDELLHLLESNGITIRHEPLDGRGGGLCDVNTQKIFFVDTQASSIQNAVLSADAIAKLIDIDNIYIKPEIREFIEKNTY